MGLQIIYVYIYGSYICSLFHYQLSQSGYSLIHCQLSQFGLYIEVADGSCILAGAADRVTARMIIHIRTVCGCWDGPLNMQHSHTHRATVSTQHLVLMPRRRWRACVGGERHPLLERDTAEQPCEVRVVFTTVSPPPPLW